MANHVIRVEPSFSVKDYDASKLVDLVRAQSYVDVDQPESGPVRVRLAASQPAKKAAAKKPAAKKAATTKKTATTRTRKRTSSTKDAAARGRGDAGTDADRPSPPRSPARSPLRSPTR